MNKSIEVLVDELNADSNYRNIDYTFHKYKESTKAEQEQVKQKFLNKLKMIYVINKGQIFDLKKNIEELMYKNSNDNPTSKMENNIRIQFEKSATTMAIKLIRFFDNHKDYCDRNMQIQYYRTKSVGSRAILKAYHILNNVYGYKIPDYELRDINAKAISCERNKEIKNNNQLIRSYKNMIKHKSKIVSKLGKLLKKYNLI